MAAAMKDETLNRWRNWEPVGRGHEALQEWARYRRDGSRTTEPTSVGKMPWKEPLDKAMDAEPKWVVLVDHAIAECVRADGVYEDIVKRFYLDGQAIWEVAPKVFRTEGFVGLCLQGICEHVKKRVAHIPKLAA